MAIVAEILIADRTLPLVGFANSISSGEISISDMAPLKDGDLLVTVSIDNDLRESFAQELDAHPEIVETAEIGQTTEGWFYQLTIHDESGLVASHDHETFEGVLLEATVTGEGLRERKVFSNYDAFSTFRDRCDVYDIPFELLTIAADPENPGERDQFGLTDKQYRALALAFSRGYYDSPRNFSTQELADELGITATSASDLLRRGENQLISQTLGPKQYLKTIST